MLFRCVGPNETNGRLGPKRPKQNSSGFPSSSKVTRTARFRTGQTRPRSSRSLRRSSMTKMQDIIDRAEQCNNSLTDLLGAIEDQYGKIYTVLEMVQELATEIADYPEDSVRCEKSAQRILHEVNSLGA